MSQSFESDDIQLNTKRFNKKKKTFLVAELVSKYAEKRRAEYRINEMQGVFPESEIQAIKSKGPLTEIYYSTKFWSDYIPWYEWLSESNVLSQCAQESGLEIWELAEFIADELKPKNWQVFSWMALAYRLSQHGSTLLEVLNEHVEEHDQALKNKRNNARRAGLASGKSRLESTHLTPEFINKNYQLLMTTGTEERNVAAKLASRFGVTPDHIRKLRKKANK
jgi:hypothetical protein